MPRQIILASRPTGWPTSENFDLAEVARPDLHDGQVRVRNLFMSVDPYMRGRMNDIETYVPPFQLGQPLDGAAIGEVIESRSDQLKVGDLVPHRLGWREEAVLDSARKVEARPDLPLSAYLGVLGTPGLTAYAGLLEVAALTAGDTVFVSAAAGAVGALAGQIAKLKGASRVIGSAGSDEKVEYLKSIGFDEAFNYKKAPVAEQLPAAAPDGIDVYFDNVGGDHLEAAMDTMNLHGRIAVCGMISLYNTTELPAAPRNLPQVIFKRLTLRGFLVSDHTTLMPAMINELGGWLQSGKLRADETVVEGLQNAPEAFLSLMQGGNIGKMIVKL